MPKCGVKRGDLGILSNFIIGKNVILSDKVQKKDWMLGGYRLFY